MGEGETSTCREHGAAAIRGNVWKHGPIWNNHGLVSDQEYLITITAGSKTVDLYFINDNGHEFIIMRYGGEHAAQYYIDTIFGLIGWCSSYAPGSGSPGRDLVYRSVVRFLLNNGSFKWSRHTGSYTIGSD